MLVAKSFVRFVWVVLVVVFLVIIAGSVVRTTQSGMGCPDWPTCFGSAIPPTDSQQVVFQHDHSYKKGQFIIYNDSLKYAVQKFVSADKYNPANWKQYEKHNYARFAVIHTWIEYINRLLGALLGLLVLAQFGWSLAYRKTHKAIVWLSFGLILLTGFQAWLGKTVVDSNLALLKITLHMFGALAMVFLSEYILFLAKGKERIIAPRRIITTNIVLGLFVVLQILMGTQVRGQIDTISEHFNYLNRSGWAEQLHGWFYIHRSFSQFVSLSSLYLVFLQRKYPLVNSLAKPIIGIVLLEIVVGIVLVYGDFPQAGQPIHLLLSSILIALIFSNLIRLKAAK